MAALDLRSLVSRLNEPTRDALEAAAGLTLSRTHYNVEFEHWLLKLLDSDTNDLGHILRHYNIDVGRLTTDLNASLDRMKTGNGRPPALSPTLVKISREAWLVASLKFGAGEVRSGHLLAAVLNDDDLALHAYEASSQLRAVPAESLLEDLAKVVQSSDEESAAASAVASGDGASSPTAPRKAGGALDKYTVDLTERARSGAIDPIIGRDAEVRQMIDILTRRRQNNPILTGEAGVGKTAAVEGFALKIVSGDVPDALKPIKLLSLDLGLLQAGAGVKGEFENRLKSVIQEVKDSPTPIIMFIDEAHTLIGAGGAEGQGDAANLLKPALARGEMRTIAATTWAEYKKYFEKDPALTRRFQVVKIEEPAEETAVQMMRALSPVLEKHHGVEILDEAIDASVRLSHRYIPGRQLPDKSISLLDTACARVGISQASTPARVEDAERRIHLLNVEAERLEREAAAGVDHAERLDASRLERNTVEEELQALNARWEEERGLCKEIVELRATLAAEQDSDAAQLHLSALAEKKAALSEAQGEDPLVFHVVDQDAVADVLAGWTGIPVGRVATDEITNVLKLDERMGARIKGQPQALSAISEAMQISQAKLRDPRKPIGVFLMCGTSGVGKTETALTLADLMYGGEQNVTVINMSEFKEEHKVSMLVGSPPGYVGYGEGGVLTEAVRRRPYSIVLLDEMEKAHPGVQDVFFQVFDKGMLKDGQGRDIDFKNTIIIMTSNAGTDTIEKLSADPDTMPDTDGLAEALRPELLTFFKPAFLGRVTLVPYFPLSDDVIKEIVKINLRKLEQRVAQNYRATLQWTDEVVSQIAARCTESQSGARNIENVIRRVIQPVLAEQFLQNMADGKAVTAINIKCDGDSGFAYEFV
ncbi:MAG: type VI secretion system ATPase TssH [Pseudomonadota bacterium]